QTSIYSLGLDFDLLGPQSAFQPFIYVGVGYVETKRSYYFLEEDGDEPVFLRDPTQTGVSGNVGLGFRLKLANSVAFELEAFAYAVNIHRPNPLLNIFGSAGIRLFL